MTKQECKRIAEKIAALEKIIKTTTDPEEKCKAERKIVKICSSFRDIAAMLQIDEAVQEIMKNS